MTSTLSAPKMGITVLHLGPDAGFHVFDVDGRFVLAWMLFQGSYYWGARRSASPHHLGQLLALWRPW